MVLAVLRFQTISSLQFTEICSHFVTRGLFCTFDKNLLLYIVENCVDSIKHAIAVYPPAVSVGAVPVLDVAKMPNGKSP